MTIQQFKFQAIKSLESGKNPSPSAALDVAVLMEHCIKKSKTWILLHASDELTDEQFKWLSEAVAKRASGIPVAYIMGCKEFYGYEFFVSPDVLIPKPDTEILVENALDEIIAKMDARPEIVLSICDMCTGSGCIGISVLKQLLEEYKIPSGWIPKLTMADISPEALEIARQNAKNLLPEDIFEDIRFIQTNLFSEIEYSFDIILTNPPYIPSSMVDELLKDGRNEPRLALDGDVNPFGLDCESADGLELIRSIIPQAHERLTYNGVLLMETGEYNAEQTEILFKQNGFRRTKIYRDLEGQLRVTSGVK